MTFHFPSHYLPSRTVALAIVFIKNVNDDDDDDDKPSSPAQNGLANE